MKIHLIRHGQTIWHNENKYSGITNIDLDSVGLQQSQDLIPWISTQSISKIVSSDLARAISTAIPASCFLGLNIEIDSRFREVNFGKVEGLNPKEFKENYPQVWQKFQIFPAQTELPGGETGEAAARRAMAGIFDLVRGEFENEVAIFSHGTMIRLVMCRLLGLGINDYRRIFPKFNNTSIATLGFPASSRESDFQGQCSLIGFKQFHSD